MSKTTIEKKVSLINSIAVYVLKSDKYVHQHWDYNARHLVFQDKFQNIFGVRLVQNTKDNNYEVGCALQKGGLHLGVERIKSRKAFVEFVNKVELYSIASLKASEQQS